MARAISYGLQHFISEFEFEFYYDAFSRNKLVRSLPITHTLGHKKNVRIYFRP